MATSKKTATRDHTPGDVSKDDMTSDVNLDDLDEAANSGPVEPELMTAEVWPEPVVTIQEQGIGPRDPYPTGNPPEPLGEFRSIFGYDRRVDDDKLNDPFGGPGDDYAKRDDYRGVDRGVHTGKGTPNEGVQPLGVGPSGKGGPEPTPNEGVQPVKGA